jgi:hypothetical protein
MKMIKDGGPQASRIQEMLGGNFPAVERVPDSPAVIAPKP